MSELLSKHSDNSTLPERYISTLPEWIVGVFGTLGDRRSLDVFRFPRPPTEKVNDELLVEY